MVTSFSLHKVRVTVFSSKLKDSYLELTARFEPQPGFSLYGMNLPSAGVGGLGRPTRFKVFSEGILERRAPLELPVAIEKNYPDLGIKLPIYPTGRVEVTRFYRVKSSANLSNLIASFTYMSCSQTLGCTLPVIDKKFI